MPLRLILDAELLPFLNFLILSSLPFSSGTVRLSVFRRRSQSSTYVEPKTWPQLVIWAWWMRLRRAGGLCHIRLIEASRGLGFCSFDSKWVSPREYRFLDQSVLW